jgi:hypothetical protein
MDFSAVQWVLKRSFVIVVDACAEYARGHAASVLEYHFINLSLWILSPCMQDSMHVSRYCHFPRCLMPSRKPAVRTEAGTCRGSGMCSSGRGRTPVAIPGQLICELWWTEWPWHKFSVSAMSPHAARGVGLITATWETAPSAVVR